MTTTETEAKAPAAPADTERVQLAPRTADHYLAILADVPDAGDAGMEGILDAIASAGSAAQLDSPWQTGGLEAFANEPLRIEGIRKAESDYEGGLPYFLILDAVALSSGERVSITTGSIAVVAQLLKAYSLGALPWTAIPRAAKRSAPGRRPPMHLESVR